MIPSFVMLRRLMLTAWVASHADADAAIAFTDGFAKAPSRWPSATSATASGCGTSRQSRDRVRHMAAPLSGFDPVDG